jgi:hypothetical protein
VFASLAAGALYFSSTSRSNRSAALRWRTHALQSDRLVTTRTHQLNVRSAALNRTAAELDRSQADVRKLEARQRALANEKAQVEDQRGQMIVQASQLTTLATEQKTCSDELGQLLSDFANNARRRSGLPDRSLRFRRVPKPVRDGVAAWAGWRSSARSSAPWSWPVRSSLAGAASRYPRPRGPSPPPC